MFFFSSLFFFLPFLYYYITLRLITPFSSFFSLFFLVLFTLPFFSLIARLGSAQILFRPVPINDFQDIPSTGFCLLNLTFESLGQGVRQELTRLVLPAEETWAAIKQQVGNYTHTSVQPEALSDTTSLLIIFFFFFLPFELRLLGGWG